MRRLMRTEKTCAVTPNDASGAGAVLRAASYLLLRGKLFLPTGKDKPHSSLSQNGFCPKYESLGEAEDCGLRLNGSRAAGFSWERASYPTNIARNLAREVETRHSKFR